MPNWIQNLQMGHRSLFMFIRQFRFALKSKFKILVLAWTHDEESLKAKLRRMSPQELRELGLSPMNFRRK